MRSTNSSSVKDRRRDQDKVWRRALYASLVFHALIFLFWRHTPIPTSPFAAAGPRAGDNRAAAGGMQALNVQAPPTVPITPPPVPLPTLEDVEPIEIDTEVRVDAGAALGNAPGDLQGPGLENGQGKGDGGTDEEGTFRLVPPSPRGMILPPSSRDLKGRQVEVWVFVGVDGRVVADSTRLNPPTPSRSFNERLIREAAEWVFRPATKGGEAVAAWFPYTISM
ncbi:MAG: hypothetical protein R3E98_20555 [Gemmatimonadota bacterium]